MRAAAPLNIDVAGLGLAVEDEEERLRGEIEVAGEVVEVAEE